MVDDELLEDHIESGYSGGELPDEAQWDDFYIDKIALPTRSIQSTDLSRFEPKQTVGAYDKDSDAVMSAWIIDDWRGGQLINKHIPGGTDQRFRSACAWSLNSQQLAPPPKVERADPWGILYDGGTGSAPYPNVFHASVPLGEFNKAFWYSLGSQLFKLTTIPNALDEVENEPIASLYFPAVNTGAVYGPPLADHSLPERRPRLWIPLGREGIQNVRDDDGISPLESTIKAIAVKAWDKHLFALTIDGYLRRYTQWDGDYTGAWEAAATEMKINRDQIPMGLEVFYDKSGNQTLFVATDKQMWAFDPETVTLIPTSLAVPTHPDNGWGFQQWRDDGIYYSTGIGVERYSRDAVNTPVGMDRDSGMDDNRVWDMYPVVGTSGLALDAQFREESDDPTVGTILPPTVPFIGAMTGSLNYLMAGVGRGVHDLGGGQYESRLSIEVYNELGWHTIADFSVTTDGCWVTPGPMAMSETVGGYRLWMGMLAWGQNMTTLEGPELSTGEVLEDYAGQLRLISIQIPRHRSGPLQQVTRQVMRFERSAYIDFGWYTSGMEGFDKLNSHAEVYLEKPPGIDTVNGYVGLYMRTMEGPDTWEFLGRADTFGRNIMPMGRNPDGFAEGVGSQGVEFRLVWASTSDTAPPIVSTFILKYIKLPLPGRAWIASVPLDAPNWRGMGPQELDDFVARKTYEPKFTRLVIGDDVYRGRIAQHQAIEGSGGVPFKQTTVNAVEVPMPDGNINVEAIEEDGEGVNTSWDTVE